MHRRQQFSTFQSYFKDRERQIKRALSEIEKRGAAAALDKCRVLAEQIDGDLRNKKRRHLFNNLSLLAYTKRDTPHRPDLRRGRRVSQQAPGDAITKRTRRDARAPQNDQRRPSSGARCEGTPWSGLTASNCAAAFPDVPRKVAGQYGRCARQCRVRRLKIPIPHIGD
jgi:hypothetical protein